MAQHTKDEDLPRFGSSTPTQKAAVAMHPSMGGLSGAETIRLLGYGGHQLAELGAPGSVKDFLKRVSQTDRGPPCTQTHMHTPDTHQN